MPCALPLTRSSSLSAHSHSALLSSACTTLVSAENPCRCLSTFEILPLFPSLPGSAAGSLDTCPCSHRHTLRSLPHTALGCSRHALTPSRLSPKRSFAADRLSPLLSGCSRKNQHQTTPPLPASPWLAHIPSSPAACFLSRWLPALPG